MESRDIYWLNPKQLGRETYYYYKLQWQVVCRTGSQNCPERRSELKLWPKNTAQESQQPCSERSWWTFHILPFVHVNANSGMWYPVHILCYYSTIPCSTFCYARTYWLCVCCGVKRALVATFCPDVSLFKQWIDGFLKKTLKCPKTCSQLLFMLKEFPFTLTVWADGSNYNFSVTIPKFFL